MLDDLVQQFADPFAFYRELIQNAIDAGSLEVEVAFDWTPNDAGGGRLTVYLEDWGEGMNRDIIEGKLTRLFSSGKDSDFTKIGKFGIGFVSVFAIAPDAVCVDTGREGESWRVLFSEDRSWELFELDFPREGTQIRVFKDLEDEAARDAFIARSRAVIRQWCRHVEIPIRIEGEDVREAFEVPEALVSARYEEEGTRIVAAVVPIANGPFGFYNRGLLLQEGNDGRFPYVGFKIDSRYLEHTLTRDQVVRDDKFNKAMRLIEAAIDDLRDTIVLNLVRLAPEGPSQELADNLRALRLIGSEPPDGAEILPVVGGRGASKAGGAMSFGAARKAHAGDGLLIAPEADDLTEALFDQGIGVLHGHPKGELHRLLKVRGLEPTAHGDSASVLRLVDTGEMAGEKEGAAALLAEVERLVRAQGGNPTWIGFGAAGPTPALRAPILVLSDRGAVLDHDDHGPASVRALSRAAELAIDPNHPIVAAALRLATTEPELAAYQLVKASVLETGLDPTDDTVLVEAAIAARSLRMRRS